ncbi:MAG: hypothetical protein ACREIP_00875, partial [Alphaproteobacteria bacterium]
MALKIETFSNQTGGASFFKAISHPLAAPLARALVAKLAKAGPVALYDPLGFAPSFAEIYPLTAVAIAGGYVQKVEALDRAVLGHRVKPVTELAESLAKIVFIPAFDAERLVAHIRHLLPPGAAVLTLDDMRLAEPLLTNPARYLDPLNFATNFAFFRDAERHHTRIVTANYWFGYGARGMRYWARLFAADG